MKKLIAILLLLNFIYSTVHCMAKQGSDKQQQSILSNVLQVYGVIKGETVIHEMGHMLAGKGLFNCRGLMYVNPNPLTINSGGCFLYNGPRLPLYSPYLWETENLIGESTTAKLFKKQINIQEKLLEQVFPMHVTGKKGALMYAAGPTAGILGCLGMPVATTFFHEYCKQGSLSGAWKSTQEKSYINDENLQSPGILAASLWKFMTDYYANLLPTIKGNDGYNLLECLKVTVAKVRAPIIAVGTALPLFAAGKFCMNYFFKDSNKSK